MVFDPRSILPVNFIGFKLNIEARTIGMQYVEKHMFKNFTEENVVRIAQADAMGTFLRIQALPSFDLAMRHLDMCHEVFSIMPVVVEEASIVMSQEEVRTMLAQNGPYPLGEDVRVPGLGGLSRFGEIYQ